MTAKQKLTNLRNALTVVRAQKKNALAEVDRLGMEEVRLTEEILQVEQYVYSKELLKLSQWKEGE